MFHGCLVAIVTPMHTNGDVDYPALERLVAWQLEQGTDGLVVLGTTGESATITPDERTKIITQVIKQVANAVPVIIGTGTNATALSITLTRQAMELGADAALLVTPYYNKPSQEGLYQHYRAVANAVPIPQILYNVPGRTGCDLLPETVKRLSSFSNIVGLKDATGDLERLRELLALQCSVDLLTGDDGTSMEFILNGGKGVISVTANVAPATMRAMCAAARENQVALATEVNQQLAPLYRELFAESNPIPTKWALAQLGLIEDGIRLPLTPLNKKYHAGVRQAMQAANVSV